MADSKVFERNIKVISKMIKELEGMIAKGKFSEEDKIKAMNTISILNNDIKNLERMEKGR